MKLERIEFAFLLLFAGLTQKCEYSPINVYERPVSKDILPPQIQTLVLDINYDTIFLYTEKIINFRFSSSNQEIKMVRFVIDNDPKFTINSDNGTFNLTYGTLSDGLHMLVLEVYTATGSNSIAELMGAERYLFSKSWKIIVDRSYYSRTTASASNGYLKLSWPQYRDYDFKEYVITRVLSYNNEVEIKRLKSTEFIDSMYVGEGGSYNVRVSNQNSQLFDWGHIELARELPEMKLMPTESEPFILNCGKVKYYNAVDTIKLSQSLNYTYNYINVKTTQNPNDTIYVLETGFFADDVDFVIKYVPKKGNIRYTTDYYEIYESQAHITLGFPFIRPNTPIFSIDQVNRDEFVYLEGCDSIIRYSVSEKRQIEQLGYRSLGCSKCEFSNITLSSSGKYITNYVNCNFDLMLVTSNNMNNYIIRDLKPYSGQNYAPEIFVSDVGTAIVNKANNGGFIIYDFTTNTSLAFYQKTNYGGTGLFISPNGNYLFLLDDSLRLVTFANSQFTNVWSHDRFVYPKYFGFDGANPEQMFIWDGTTFSVKLCNDFSGVYDFSLSDQTILDIDFYNKEMLTYNSGHLFVKSYLNGSLIKDLPIHIDPSFYNNSFILVNHAIISMKGVIYFNK
jgi:hypothetical protein